MLFDGDLASCLVDDPGKLIPLAALFMGCKKPWGYDMDLDASWGDTDSVPDLRAVSIGWGLATAVPVDNPKTLPIVPTLVTGLVWLSSEIPAEPCILAAAVARPWLRVVAGSALANAGLVAWLETPIKVSRAVVCGFGLVSWEIAGDFCRCCSICAAAAVICIGLSSLIRFAARPDSSESSCAFPILPRVCEISDWLADTVSCWAINENGQSSKYTEAL